MICFNKMTVVNVIIILLLSSCATTNTNRSKSSSQNNRTDKAHEISPDSGEMLNLNLGVGYLKRGTEGDIDVALEKFKKALAFNPKFALAHSMLATVYDRKGLFESAEKHYKLSIKYNNGSPDVLNNYANFLCQRGSYDEAIVIYEKVISNPKYNTPSSAYENAGVCAYKANNFSRSEDFFRSALKFNKKQSNSLYYLMLINLKNNNLMSARAFLQRLEQVVPEANSDILIAGYQIEKGLNHDNRAHSYLTTLKNKFPESVKLLNK